jgi:restriction system protein
VAKRRGFFAELQHQAQQAERQRQLHAATAYQARIRAQIEADRARAAAERARTAAAVGAARERELLEREAARLHVASQLAEAESRNAMLGHTYDEIDRILAATLAVDDHVDLAALTITTVGHPPFDPGGLGTPTPPMPDLVYPPAPGIAATPPAGLFGRKKHETEVERVRAEHERATQQWQAYNTTLYSAHVAELERRTMAEQARLAKLAEAHADYQEQCRQRESDAEARNQELAKLINDLAFDVESAIQEYVSIVLSKSAYPDAFPVAHEHDFDLATRELTLTVTVPTPSSIPAVKAYRYVKANDEITATALPIKAQKDRYAGAVFQTALRTLHEIFEADRGAKIHSIALTVAAETPSAATGRMESVPLVILAADRETFATFNLTNVVPSATLDHLGAAVSKSPFDLTPADTSRGVRARKQ